MSFDCITDKIVDLTLVLILYICFGYSIILYFLAKLFPRKHSVNDHYFPRITLIISAQGDELAVSEKIKNCLSIDYPENSFSVVVISDGAIGQLDEMVRSFNDPRVKLMQVSPLQGQAFASYPMIAGHSSDIVIFSDTQAMFESSAVKKLVRHFSDEKIGYVVGNSLHYNMSGACSSGNDRMCWDPEKFLQKLESAYASVVGNDGAMYAVRGELCEQLKWAESGAFVEPLSIIGKGYRGIFEQEALYTVEKIKTVRQEFSRKAETSYQNFNALLDFCKPGKPRHVGMFVWLSVSHKLLRGLLSFIVSIFFIAVLVAAQPDLKIYSCLVFCIMFSVCSLVGWGQRQQETPSCPVFSYPYFLALTEFAAAQGLLAYLKDRLISKRNTGGVSCVLRFQTTGLLPFLLVGCCIACIVRLALWFGYTSLLLNGVTILLLYAIFHTYLVYPLWLALFARMRPVILKLDAKYEPTVTLLIVAYNEEQEIEEKLVNSLAIDYPADKLTIIVASDGSSDRTNEIVRKFVGPQIQLFDFKVNRGKIGALNEAMQRVDSEIVVLSDANVMYDREAIVKIVRNLSDSRVGAVSGKVALLSDGVSYGDSEGLYYRIEHYIQQKEGETGGLIGSDGAMYAIRRSLFIPPPSDTILDDFVIPMQVAIQGQMVLHDSDALGYEKNSLEIDGEFKRKVRIIAGGVQCLVRDIAVPSPLQPLLFCKFISHKLLRWILGPMTLTLIGLLLWIRFVAPNLVFTFFLYSILAATFVGLMSHWLPITRKISLVSLCHYLFVLNIATFVGWYLGLAGKQKVKWRSS